MSYTIQEVARALGAEALGDTGIEIDGAAEPADAGERHLALAMKPEYAEALPRGRARAGPGGFSFDQLGSYGRILATTLAPPFTRCRSWTRSGPG